jgi:hypothetical protein
MCSAGDLVLFIGDGSWFGACSVVYFCPEFLLLMAISKYIVSYGGIFLPPTCQIIMSTCQIFLLNFHLFTCLKIHHENASTPSLHHPVNNIFFWHVDIINIMATCQMIMSVMSTCQIFLWTCQIFMSTCQIIMLTCHIKMSTCQMLCQLARKIWY